MVGEKELDIVTSRKQSVWINGCPIRITEVKLCTERDTNDTYLAVISKSCTDRRIESFLGDVVYFNSRKEKISECAFVKFMPEYSIIKADFSHAASAQVNIKEVRFADGTCWVNDIEDLGEIPPEQNIIWQTDPLYKVIKRLSAGRVDAKYYPDEIDGGWRCACGNINIDDSVSCGACKCSREWLKETFKREYLESQISLIEEGKKPISVKKVKKKQAERLISDKTKMMLIFASLVVIIVLLVLSVVYIIPQARYNSAHKYATRGEYDKAIEIFEDLGRFKNSQDLVHTFTYEKYVNLTGVADLYITDSVTEPWFRITESGTLEFIDTKYEGEWDHFNIPHVVDGIVVTELAKNFFLNCDELASVNLPDTLLVIGEQAFMNCTSLEKIKLGSRITDIQPRVFINCTSLTEITIPDSVCVFGQRMFNNCKKLEKITLGTGIDKIEAFTFSNCELLQTIHLKSPITAVAESAFESCKALSEIVCSFDENKWCDPIIESDNEYFVNAKIKFN